MLPQKVKMMDKLSGCINTNWDKVSANIEK